MIKHWHGQAPCVVGHGPSGCESTGAKNLSLCWVPFRQIFRPIPSHSVKTADHSVTFPQIFRRQNLTVVEFISKRLQCLATNNRQKYNHMTQLLEAARMTGLNHIFRGFSLYSPPSPCKINIKQFYHGLSTPPRASKLLLTCHLSLQAIAPHPWEGCVVFITHE